MFIDELTLNIMAGRGGNGIAPSRERAVGHVAFHDLDAIRLLEIDPGHLVKGDAAGLLGGLAGPAVVAGLVDQYRRMLEDNLADYVENFGEYFGRKGYVSLALYYKNLTDYIFNASKITDFTGVALTDVVIAQGEKSVKVQVPILGDIPLLGQAFRTDRKTKSRTELYIVVTPHIVRRVQSDAPLPVPVAPAAQLAPSPQP